MQSGRRAVRVRHVEAFVDARVAEHEDVGCRVVRGGGCGGDHVLEASGSRIGCEKVIVERRRKEQRVNGEKNDESGNEHGRFAPERALGRRTLAFGRNDRNGGPFEATHTAL